MSDRQRTIENGAAFLENVDGMVSAGSAISYMMLCLGMTRSEVIEAFALFDGTIVQEAMVACYSIGDDVDAADTAWDLVREYADTEPLFPRTDEAEAAEPAPLDF